MYNIHIYTHIYIYIHIYTYNMSNPETKENDQVVTPWTVNSKNGIDYLRLVNDFGVKLITHDLLKRWERVTGTEVHLWLKRGIFFSHQDLELILDGYEKGNLQFLYTGRGPTSEALHIGHMLQFYFATYLQKALQCIIVIQMSDDEKYVFKPNMSLAECERLTKENAKDIIACGFDPQRTFIFSNTEFYGGDFYRMVCMIDKNFTVHQLNKVYGFTDQNNIGEISWPSKQLAPSFARIFPHLFAEECKTTNTNIDNIQCFVSMAIDQSPYFRSARDFADSKKEGIKFTKPATIMSKFLPALEGANSKMSSSTGSQAIFMNMTYNEVHEVVKKYAFSGSGGNGTRKDHEKYGGDLLTDISYQYLLHFMDDDIALAKIAHEFSSGKMMSSEVKKIMSDILWKYVETHQHAKAKIDNTVLDDFFSRKTLNLSRVHREPFIRNDKDYETMGYNFDQTFGAKRPIVSE